MDQQELPVAKHFAAHRHSVSQVRVMIIDHTSNFQTGGNRELQLKHREVKWIAELDTIQSKGLNVDLALFLFL